MNWDKELERARELQPAHRRHVYATEKLVIKVALEPDEPDHFGDTHDVEFTRLLDENHALALSVVEQYTTIPIPKLLHHSEGVLVLEMIEGVDLDEAWKRVSSRQLEGIKLELLQSCSSLFRGSETRF